MPASYEYDPATRFLDVRYSGVVTEEDILKTAHAVAEDKRVGPDVRELVDVSGVERLDASLQTLLTVVTIKCSYHDKFQGHRIAVVAPSGSLSRLANLYGRGSCVADAPPEVRVFQTRDEAVAWLEESGDEAIAS